MFILTAELPDRHTNREYDKSSCGQLVIHTEASGTCEIRSTVRAGLSPPGGRLTLASSSLLGDLVAFHANESGSRTNDTIRLIVLPFSKHFSRPFHGLEVLRF